MIFAKLFKSQDKYKHKNLNIRITAINDDLSAATDIEILQSLAQQDDSDLVRRAALLKLNSFEHWFSASQSNSMKKIQAYAEKQVQDILFEQHTIKLSLLDKQKFLADKSHKTAFLENWLKQENNSELIIAIYQKLLKQAQKPQLLVTLFAQKQDEHVQQFLLAQLQESVLVETNLLEKLLKKAVNEKITKQISDTISALEQQKQKPIKLRKQVQLVLSKLLALKDNADFGVYSTKLAMLEQEWQQLKTDFNCLSSEEVEEFTAKQQTISQQLVKIFAPKAEAYQQQKIAEKLLADKKVTTLTFEQTMAEISQVLTTAVFENTPLDQQIFSAQLTEFSEQIQNSVLSDVEQAAFLEQVKQQQKRLTQLPEIAESVTQATHLISKISQLALPSTLDELNERQQIFKDWQKQWHEVEQKSNGILPQSIKDAHKEISKTWQSGLKPLQNEQKNLFNQSKKKLNDLKRLLAGGKYKVSFGLFKGLSKSMPLLSSFQQHQLQRDFEYVSEKIAEISDWEHYIATPRKQQLLTEISQLVENPLDNPNEQAEKVKHFRKVWNSLGHADEEVDQNLNNQFNEACEQAFAPCRLYYAEQDKLRDQHFKQRTNIIEQAKAITQAFEQAVSNQHTPDFKELDGQLNKIQQLWFDAGEVDREKYQMLQKQYKQVLQPVKNAIKSFHDNNLEKKNQLIILAKQQLEQDDIFEAIEQVKQLQQQWKTIGYAGSRHENKLWQAFRKANDELFSKRDEVKNQQQQAQISQKNDFNKLFESLKSAGESISSTDKTALISHKQQVEKLLTEVVSNKPVIKAIASALEQYISQIENKIKQIAKAKERQNWLNVFEVLSDISNENITNVHDLDENNDYQVLTHFWQKKVQEQIALSATEQNIFDARSQQTLALEILAGIESPAEFAQQRMEVQVKLMQQQMQSGNEINLQKCFIDWLQLGKLTKQDKALLERLKVIFC